MAVPTLMQAARLTIHDQGQRELLEKSKTALERGIGGRGMSPEAGDALLPESTGMQTLPGMGRVEQPDLVVMRESLKATVRTLEKGRPPVLTAHEKTLVNQRFKVLTQAIREGMPSHDQMQRDTADNLEQHMRWEDANQHKIQAWKNYGRILDPARDFSIEHLRPHTATPTDWRKFYAHFDHMKFADDVARQTELRQLDPEVYDKFCLLRQAGVETPKLIQRSLSISQAVYEACLERWGNEMAGEAIFAQPENDGETSAGETDAEDAEAALSGDDLDLQLLSYIEEKKGLRLGALVQKFGVDKDTLQERLKALQESGLITERQGLYHAATSAV